MNKKSLLTQRANSDKSALSGDSRNSSSTRLSSVFGARHIFRYVCRKDSQFVTREEHRLMVCRWARRWGCAFWPLRSPSISFSTSVFLARHGGSNIGVDHRGRVRFFACCRPGSQKRQPYFYDRRPTMCRGAFLLKAPHSDSFKRTDASKIVDPYLQALATIWQGSRLYPVSMVPHHDHGQP